MARGTTQRERQEAVPVTVITPGDPDSDLLDDDVEQAFDDWRATLKGGEQPGMLRAYQIPIDERGNPMANASNQMRLGAWPIDLYGFDELCEMLKRDYMPAQKVLAVRLIGTKAGARGVRFNKIVVLRAPNDPPRPPGNGAESTADIMRAVNENNEKMLAQFRAALSQATPPPDPRDEMRRMIEMTALLNGPSQKLMELLVPALAGRPAAAAPAGGDPFSQLGGLVDLIDKIQGMRGEGGDNASSGNDVVDAIRAVIPIARPALEALPAILAAGRGPAALPNPQPTPPQRPPPGARPPPPPVGARPPAPGSVPTRPNTQPQPAAPGGAMGDIPSGDQEMFAQLKPQIDALVKMASEGGDPTGAADLLFEQVIMPLPDEYYSRLSDIIGGPNFLTQAAVFNPSVNAHAEWFKQFRARVVERYDAEEKAAGPGVPTA